MPVQWLQDEDELVEIIKRRYSDIQVSVSDLKNPTRSFLHDYFMRYFEEFGADVSALMEPSSEQLQAIEYSAAFKGVLHIINYFCAVKYIFRYMASNIKISLTDLTEPNPNKTKLLIKCAEEFYKYADLKASEVLIPVEMKVLEKKGYYDHLFCEVERAKDIVNKRASEEAQLRLHIQQLNGQLTADDVNLTELKMQNMKLDEENKDKIEEVTQCQTVLDEVQAEKAQLNEALADLQFKVSQLPTEATLAVVREKRMKLEEQLACAAKRVEEKNSRITDAENSIKRWNDIYARLEEVAALEQKLQSNKTNLEAVEKQQASEDEQQEAVEEKCRKLQAKLAQLAKLGAARKAQWLEKRTLLEKKIEEDKRTHKNLRKEKGEEQKELKELEDVVLEKEKELHRLKAENQRICRLYDEKFIKLQKKHDETLHRLTTGSSG